MQRNPLTVLPASSAGDGLLTITDLQFVGNDAVRRTVSDGPRIGVYSWHYLREIDPNA